MKCAHQPCYFLYFYYLGVMEDLQVLWVDLEYNAIEQVFTEPSPGGWHKGLEHQAYHIIRVTSNYKDQVELDIIYVE